jgi:hypothetical protein
MIAGLAVDCAKKGPTIEERIKSLETKGVPDSVLSSVKVYLYNVTNLGKTGQIGKARLFKDSLKTGIVAAEAWYDKAMQENKTYIESIKKTINDGKSKLTGLPLKDCDSLLKVADSFVSINWLIQARTKFDDLNGMMPVFLKNQERAAELRPKLYGTWKDVHVLRPPEDEEGANYKATETRIYSFAKDGGFTGVEEMHGQTTPYIKEDWKFLSWGTFDLMGDSIYLFITREKCAQQVFTQFNNKTKKWDRLEKPTYDSTITNNKKDKFITYDDLKIAFKKVK